MVRLTKQTTIYGMASEPLAHERRIYQQASYVLKLSTELKG